MIKDRVKSTIQRFRPKRNEEKRIVLIDFYKGLIILVMIITHVIGLTFNYSFNDSTVYYVGLIGGIVSFTGFLLLLGINGYLSVINKEESAEKSLVKIFGREIKIFATYYVLTLAALFVLSRESFATPRAFLNSIGDILTFNVLPEFTEFLPTLAVFTLTLVLFKRIYRYLADRLLISTIVGLIIYFIGNILVNLDFGNDRLNSIKALFFGHLTSNDRIHSFPIVQYFIIFILGVCIGKFLYENTNQKIRLRFTTRLLSITIPATIALAFLYETTKISIFYPLPVEGRFPPSISFLTLSLSIALIFLVLIDYLISYIPDVASRFLTYISKNTLGFLLAHLLILFGFKYYFDTSVNPTITQPTNFQEILVMFLLTVALCFVFVNILNSINKNVIESDQFRRISKFIIVVGIPNITLIVTIVAFGFIVYNNFLTGSDASRGIAYPLAKTIRLNQSNSDWWDNAYKAKRSLIIENNGVQDYTSDQWVEFSFNTNEALNNKLMFNANSSDMRIVYWNPQQSNFEVLPFILESPNTDNSTIKFQLKNSVISGRADTNYTLYYGNAAVSEYPRATSEVKNIVKIAISSDVNLHEINATTNRFWFIKNPDTKIIKDHLTVDATIDESVLNENTIATYKVDGTDIAGTMSREGSKFTTKIELANLDPEVYTVEVRIVDLVNNLKIYHSHKVPFKVSYPMYVTWTLDWEGWDVSQYNLNEMDNIANLYGMPITHLFNPRIYVETQTSYEKIFPDRAEYLTDWVLDRRNSRGDEIGMHMHMFSDMVQAAGVQPRAGSIVGAAYGDAKTSDFTQQELEKIFSWGVQKFAENGLPIPKSYRTGGWFSGPHVLKAAQNTGFLIDTSGRTGGIINPALPYSSPVPWNLPVTTRPYKPTNGDINRWEGDRLSIWEFPNNGADSYWFTADELKNRFIENYTDPRGILDDAQILTYLSHPHWLGAIDSPKLHNLFKFLTQYSYKNDNGPVIFTTLEKAYDEWDKSDINGN